MDRSYTVFQAQLQLMCVNHITLKDRVLIILQINHEYVITFPKAKDLTPELLENIQKSIKSHQSGSGEVQNKLSVIYKSQRDGGAVLSGVLTPTSQEWLVSTLDGKAIVEPKSPMDYAAIRTSHTSSWFAVILC